MTIREAINRIIDHMEVHHIGLAPHIHIGEALNMAILALMEQEHRDVLPLGLEELRKMDGQTVYCLDVNTEVTVHAPRVGLIHISYLHYILKASEVTLYRTRLEKDDELY